MKKYYKLIVIFCIILGALPVKSQIKGLNPSTYYSSTDYNSTPQNWSVTQDHRGIMYFGNSSCILEYDGVSWRNIFVSN